MGNIEIINGYKVLTTIVNNQLITRKYMVYSIRECKALFKQEIKEIKEQEIKEIKNK